MQLMPLTRITTITFRPSGAGGSIRRTTRISARSTSSSASRPASSAALLSDRHAPGAAGARPAVLLEPAGLQRLRDRPRPHHGVLHGDADADRRLRQLVRAADDRRAGHGLPADEQHLVLAHRLGLRPDALLALRRGRSGLARLRRRLDGLSAALDRPAIPARRSTSASWRCTSPARPRSSARSTSSPRSSTCARRA